MFTQRSFQHLIVVLMLVIPGVLAAADWNFLPRLYSRGGITLKEDLSREGINRDNFNLGGWAQESNAIFNPLTELTLEATSYHPIRIGSFGKDKYTNRDSLFWKRHKVTLNNLPGK